MALGNSEDASPTPLVVEPFIGVLVYPQNDVAASCLDPHLVKYRAFVMELTPASSASFHSA